MRLKFLSLIAVVALAAACATPATETGSATGEGAAGPGTQADLVANVGDRVHFCFDCYDLNADARATLQKQAEWMKTNGNVTVMIEGHCDERGTREYNLALGNRRASAVQDYLSSLGVSADRLTTISYGKERPHNPASDETAWAENRRAVTVVR